MTDQEVKNWQNEKAAERLIKKLEARGFEAFYAPTAEEACEKVLNLIPAEGTIAIVGSQTLEQIGVNEKVRASGRKLSDPAKQQNLTPAENLAFRKSTLTSDILLSGVNAIDEDGLIYNIDGIGNRVAAMIFGPDTVILALGLNKLAKGPKEAWHRARNVASPLNNKRLNRPNPCAETGQCHDCSKDSRICNYFSTIHGSFPKGRIKVVLIGGEYGY